MDWRERNVKTVVELLGNFADPPGASLGRFVEPAIAEQRGYYAVCGWWTGYQDPQMIWLPYSKN